MEILNRKLKVAVILWLFGAMAFAQQPVIVSTVPTSVSPCSSSTNGTCAVTITKNGTNNFVFEIRKTLFSPAYASYGPTTDTTYTFTNLEKSSYVLIIGYDTPAPGGFVVGGFIVGGPSALSFTSQSATNITCNGLTDGKINVAAAGETNTITYNLFNSLSAFVASNATGNFTGLSKDTYTVQASDATCPGTATSSALAVNEPAIISISSATSSNVTCNGSADGTINVSATGGTSPYAYTLTPGGTTNGTGSFLSLGPNTYSVSVTDANSCPAATAGPLSVTEPAVITASVASANITCNGANDGTITISGASGGYGSYEYSINGSSWQSSGIFTSLSPATYNVQIRDQLHPSCVIVLNPSLTLTEPTAMTATVTSVNVTCNGGNNGSITISGASGGSGVYEYTINGTTWQSSGSFTTLTAGTYNVQMRDKNTPACVKVLNAALVITEPAALTATVSSVNVTICAGYNNGSITISSPSGGSGAYEYTINGTTWQSTGSFLNLYAGTYNVQMRDKNVPTCIKVLNPALVITQPAPLSATITKTDVTCYGSNTGSIVLSSPSGGSGFYQYSIDGGLNWQTGKNFLDLFASTYNVHMRNTVTPYCEATLNPSLVITQPAQLNAAVASVNVTCNGANNGSITFNTPTGGSGTFEFSINGGTSWQSSASFTGLAPASYTAMIRDAAVPTCSRTLSTVNITEPAALNATLASSNVTCFGGNDGSITISNPAGGSGSFEYTIDGSTWVSSGSFTTLIAGTYNVQMRDKNTPACVKVLNAALVITQPAVLSASVTSTNVTCNGGNDGTITIASPAGGSGLYEYTINGTAWVSSGSFTGLTAGTYNVQMRDKNAPACVKVLNATLVITQPAVLTASVSKTDVTGCFGNNNGSISITAPSGGSGAYEYTIDGAAWQGSGSFTSLVAGTYNVQMRDKNAPACVKVLNAALVITQPAVLAATVSSTNISCNGGNDGTITISSPSGGSGTYEYTINGSAWQSSGSFTGLTAGTYNVQIRDKNFPTCVMVLNAALVLTEPAVLSATVNSTNVSCNGGNDGSITISLPSGGSGAYEYTINGSAWQSSGSFTGLIAGTYNVQIRDKNAPACVIVLNPALVITQPAVLSATVSSTNVTCFGGNDGTITISAPTGGSGTYEYTVNGTTWQSSGSFASLTAGTYNVQMRDKNATACVKVLNAALVITQPAVLSATVSSTNVTCNGGNDGSITIGAPSGGSGVYEYTVNGSVWQGSGSFNGLVAGTYNVQIRDKNAPACVKVLNAALVITQPAALTATVNSTNVTCNGSNDGTITISAASGGSGAYEYTINGTTWQSSGSFSALTQASYNVQMRDKNAPACVKVLNPALVITQPAVLSATVNSTNVTCNGGNDGTITITSPTGGYGTYEYTINGTTWQSSGSFTGLIAGTYNVQMRDKTYPTCVKVLNAALVITQPAVLAATVNSTNVTCNGGNDGSITISSPAGGSGAYEYTVNGTVWQGTGLFTGLIAGTYNVQIRDKNAPACVKVLNPSLVITQPAVLNAAVAVTNVTCNGSTDGTITISSPSGGSGAYEYTIDGTTWQSSGSFTGLAAATYNVQIRDKNAPSCVKVLNAALTITQPAVLSATVNSTNVSCNGSNDGTITVTAPTGGYGTYEYTINGTTWQSSGSFTGLIAGTYNVQMRDKAYPSCVKVLNAALVITQPAVLNATVNSTNVTCNGGNDGSITISAPSGGSGVYEYTVNGTTWQSSGSFTGLIAGTYNVQIRDKNASACVIVLNPALVITQPALLTASVASTNVTCFGGNDGSITISSPSGGSGAYEYTIDGSAWQGTGTFASLTAGSYNVQIRDKNAISCVKVLNPALVITQPAVLAATVTSTNVSCNGGNDGTITIASPSGGSGAYEYTLDGASWSGSGSFTGLIAGTYNVQIRDKNNPACVMVLNAALVITQPAILAATVNSTNVTCNGGNDGTITITAPTGGSGSYEYTINGTTWQSSGSFTTLIAATYNVQIRDKNNPACVIVLNPALVISEPAVLAALVSKTDVTGCYGNNNGTISITAPSGGSGAYEYTIDGSGWQSSGSFTSLVAGTYNVQIRDKNAPACVMVLDAALAISQPAVLTATVASTNVTCNGSNDGTITFTAPSGGSGSYEYSVDGTTWQASGNFTGLTAGTYTAQIRDQLTPSCLIILNSSLLITEPTPLTYTFTKTDLTCNGMPTGIINLSASGGNGFYRYSIDGGTTYQYTGTFSNLLAGTYNISVRDTLNCNATGTIDIIQPPAISIDNEISNDVNCFGSQDGNIQILATGGAGKLLYSIDTGYTWHDNGGIFTNLPAGVYRTGVKDTNNCVQLGNYIPILEPGKLVVDSMFTSNVTCSGANNGTITIYGSGGRGLIKYSLDGGTYQVSNAFSSLAPGSHTVTMKDSVNCTLDTTITLTGPAPLLINNVVVTNISCNGKVDGKIHVDAQGGNVPYKFVLQHAGASIDSIYNPAFAEFTGLPADTGYMVILTDTNSCAPVTTPKLTIVEPAVLQFDSAVVQNITCAGSSTGGIKIYAHGGTVTALQPYEYSVDAGMAWDTAQHTNLAAGTYFTAVRDARGCMVLGDTLTLTDPKAIVVDSIFTTDVTTCGGDSTGSVRLYGSGGTGKLQYSIGNGWQDTVLFENLKAGTYHTFIRDANGCSINGPDAIINQPAPVTIDSIHKTDVQLGVNGTIQVFASGGTGTYTYSITDSTSIYTSTDGNFTDLAAALYWVRVQDSRGCNDNDTVRILYKANTMNVKVVVTNVSCPGAADGKIMLLALDGTEPIHYSIDNCTSTTTGNIFPDLAGGTYDVCVTDTLGAIFKQTITVNEPLPITAVASVTDANCRNVVPGMTDFGAISLSVSGGNGSDKFVWTDELGNQIDTAQSISGLTGGTYTVLITDSKGCQDTRSFNIGFDAAKSPVLTPLRDTSACFGNPITLEAQAVNATSFIWQKLPSLDTLSETSSLTFSTADSTRIRLMASNTFRCAAYATFSVKIKPVMGVSITNDTISVLGGTSYQLPVQIADPSVATGATFEWTPATGLNDPASQSPVFTATDKSQEYYSYVLVATSSEGCTESDTAHLRVLWDVTIPGGFTPNGDGVNDTWVIQVAYTTPVTVEVFNRWGERVFMEKTYKNEWDGTYHGKPLPLGTYYYVITINTGSVKKTFTGPLTIVR